jgi:hypothetical protein
MVGLAVLVVVVTVHFGVGSVLAIAAAALGRSLTAAVVVASDLGQFPITFRYHAGIGVVDALLSSRVDSSCPVAHVAWATAGPTSCWPSCSALEGRSNCLYNVGEDSIW